MSLAFDIVLCTAFTFISLPLFQMPDVTKYMNNTVKKFADTIHAAGIVFHITSTCVPLRLFQMADLRKHMNSTEKKKKQQTRSILVFSIVIPINFTRVTLFLFQMPDLTKYMNYVTENCIHI